jgi:hypothetical protein
MIGLGDDIRMWARNLPTLIGGIKWAISQIYFVDFVSDRDVVPLHDVTPPPAL